MHHLSDLNNITENLWQAYLRNCPIAEDIFALMGCLGQCLKHDHFALRTFSAEHVDKECIAKIFEKHGYKVLSDYEFPEKKLKALALGHAENPMKIFVSELCLERFSPEFQKVISTILEQIERKDFETNLLSQPGLLWKPICSSDYNILQSESDYAAWLASMGFVANHFAVDLDSIDLFDNIEEFTDFIHAKGFPMNTQGGLIKGSESLGLKQSATLATKIPVQFSDGDYEVPGCFYEFAERFKVKGERFEGFIPESANKIFESTNLNSG